MSFLNLKSCRCFLPVYLYFAFPCSHCEPKAEQSHYSSPLSLRGWRSPTKQSHPSPSLRGSLLLVILSCLNYVILSRLCEGSRLHHPVIASRRRSNLAIPPHHHCEERSDEAIAFMVFVLFSLYFSLCLRGKVRQGKKLPLF